MITRIDNAVIITCDPDHTCYNTGSIIIRRDRIIDLGPSQEISEKYPDIQSVVDAQGCVVLPGFVSTHNHLGYAVFRGRAEDVGTFAVKKLYLPMAEILKREERREIGNMAAVELLRGGVTTILQMEEDADVFVPILERIGMRALIGIMAHDLDVDRLNNGEIVFDPKVREQQLEQSINLAEYIKSKADSRLSPVMTANSAATSSKYLLRGLRDAADRLNTRLSIHIGIGEEENVRAVHGANTFEFARDNGFLAEDVIAVHCNRIEGNSPEVKILAESGAHLAHCPQINQFRGTIAPIRELLDSGVNVGLGIDNYFSDQYEVLRSCLAVARIRANSPSEMSAAVALDLATLHAAKVLGMDADIGSLEIGKKADIQIVDMRRYGLSPINDPIGTLVYHGHGKDVMHVMIDGRWVVRDGEVLNESETDLVTSANQASQGAWQRFHEQHGAYLVAPNQ